MISESLGNVAMLTLQSNVIVGESIQVLEYYLVQVRSGVGFCISRKVWNNAKMQRLRRRKPSFHTVVPASQVWISPQLWERPCGKDELSRCKMM